MVIKTLITTIFTLKIKVSKQRFLPQRYWGIEKGARTFLI